MHKQKKWHCTILHYLENRCTPEYIMQPTMPLRRILNLPPWNSTEQFGLLTFGMIPHITQERRAENNIHHTGRIKGIVVDAEKMWGDDWPFGCLPDNVCLSGVGGVGGWGGAGEEAAGLRTLLLWRHDVNSGPLQSPGCICVPLNLSGDKYKPSVSLSVTGT